MSDSVHGRAFDIDGPAMAWRQVKRSPEFGRAVAVHRRIVSLEQSESLEASSETRTALTQSDHLVVANRDFSRPESSEAEKSSNVRVEEWAAVNAELGRSQ